MDVLCVGMCRSGSTWQYNIAAELVEQRGLGQRVGYLTGERYADEFARSAGSSWRVFKCHERHPAFAAAIAEGRAVALYSSRDVRDVAYSLMHKHGRTFEDLFERQGAMQEIIENDAFFRAQQRTLCQRYEDITTDDITSAAAIAEHLGIDLSQSDAKTLCERFSFSSMKQKAKSQEESLRNKGVDLSNPANAMIHDAKSQIHWNHLREGKVGGWRSEATAWEVAKLFSWCGAWLIKHGYERDDSWVNFVIPQLLDEIRVLRYVNAQMADAHNQLKRDIANLREQKDIKPAAKGSR